MPIDLLFFGNSKKFYREIENDFSKQLGKITKIYQPKKNYNFLKNYSKVYLLDEKGEIVNNDFFKRIITSKEKTILCIGDFDGYPTGFLEFLKNSSLNTKKITFVTVPTTHLLTRLLVLEQLLRAKKDLEGSNYSK